MTSQKTEETSLAVDVVCFVAAFVLWRRGVSNERGSAGDWSCLTYKAEQLSPGVTQLMEQEFTSTGSN